MRNIENVIHKKINQTLNKIELNITFLIQLK